MRFATDQDYEDLTIGIDGYLVAMRDMNNTIDVFDPLANNFVRTIDLDDTLNFADVRGIRVDADGTRYLAGWDGNLYAADSHRNTLASLATGCHQLTDIDIHNSGDLMVGERLGNVIHRFVVHSRQRR